MSTYSYYIRHRNGWGTSIGPRPTHCHQCNAALPAHNPDSCTTGYGSKTGRTISLRSYHHNSGDTGKLTLGKGETVEESPAICYMCCAANDFAFMREHGRIDMYFSNGSISNWPGSAKWPTFNVTRSEGYGFGRRYPIVTGRFRFEGQLWAFRNAGDNQIARCRRLKDPR